MYANELGAARRRNRIAGAIGSILALSAPTWAWAATNWPVVACGDSGAGTLRDVIGAVTTVSGDTVDLSLLSCPQSKISLTRGEIYVTQESLTIKGPGQDALTIDGTGLPSDPGGTGPNNSRLFTHTGTGTLQIQQLTLTGGHVYHTSYAYPSRGGCVFSAGSLTISRSTVTDCDATNTGYYAAGGGLFASNALNVKYSTVSNNTVSGSTPLGGGARVYGALFMKYSTVAGNKAYSSNALGGGINASGNVTILASTVSGNYSQGGYGGVDVFAFAPANKTFQLANSTISGNISELGSGGLYVNSGTAQFYNSTIAFNQAASAPGTTLSGTIAVTMDSTLMSNNRYGVSAEDDLTLSGAITFNGGDLATPAHNLVRASFANNLPTDTIRGSCPFLGPLRDNGGLTRTHALASNSPAIDAGNNVQSGDYEQRGPASVNGVANYPRESKAPSDPDPAVADIGAYEVQQDDVLFNTGFEGCTFLL
jgi:hypothetical protein